MKTPTKKMKGGLINRGSGLIKIADRIIEAHDNGRIIPGMTGTNKDSEMILMWNEALYYANPQTEHTYSRLYEQYKNMTYSELVRYMSKQTTSGGYYKKRAGLKRAIAQAWADKDVDLINLLAGAYRFHEKPEQFTRRESKRADNSTIAADWRNKFLGKLAKSKSKHKNHALLC